ASGRYICFLSDDNGYTPEHLASLVSSLELDPTLGFSYSSCLYDGRVTLRFAPPRLGRIDLGQPVFRRELFDFYLHPPFPFREVAWDWRMIEHFLRRGARWKHIDRATFISHLTKYPHLVNRLSSVSDSH